MSVVDWFARLIGNLAKSWMDGCALHAHASLGHAPDIGEHL